LLRVGCADPLVHEVRHADGARGRRVRVGRDDHVGERGGGLELSVRQRARPRHRRVHEVRVLAVTRNAHGSGGDGGRGRGNLRPDALLVAAAAGVARCHGGGQPLDGGAAVDAHAVERIRAHRLRFPSSSARYSLLRMASAMIVSVGFLWALLANTPPSAMNRFGTSHAWPKAFVTEVAGSSPMRVVPTSWMIWPPFEIACSGVRSPPQWIFPPMRSMSAFVVCWKWRTMLSSCSLHLKWKRSVGMPKRSVASGSISQYECPFGIISPRQVKLMKLP